MKALHKPAPEPVCDPDGSRASAHSGWDARRDVQSIAIAIGKHRNAADRPKGRLRGPGWVVNRLSGFTLIELMIVVAIVGLLAAIAYPAYTDSIFKGRRAQGRTAVAQLLQEQERYITQRNCYLAFSTNASTGVATAAAAGAGCGAAPATVPFKTFSGDTLASSHYILSADNCPGAANATLSIADCVRVTATPVQADPKVDKLQMTSSGQKSCTGVPNNLKLCWP